MVFISSYSGCESLLPQRLVKIPAETLVFCVRIRVCVRVRKVSSCSSKRCVDENPTVERIIQSVTTLLTLCSPNADSRICNIGACVALEERTGAVDRSPSPRHVDSSEKIMLVIRVRALQSTISVSARLVGPFDRTCLTARESLMTKSYLERRHWPRTGPQIPNPKLSSTSLLSFAW